MSTRKESKESKGYSNLDGFILPAIVLILAYVFWTSLESGEIFILGGVVFLLLYSALKEGGWV
jgi:hypothetical protein